MKLPDQKECLKLLREHKLSEKKIEHSILVANVAVFLGKKLIEKGEKIDLELLETGALLHDIARDVSDDVNHPRDGEKIAEELGLEKVRPIIRKHGFIEILNNKFDGWEEKLVYYADKRVKNSIISIDERTKKWPDMFPEVRDKILESIILAKELEKEIFSKLDFKPEELEREISR